jgi:hypothetical protein
VKLLRAKLRNLLIVAHDQTKEQQLVNQRSAIKKVTPFSISRLNAH